MRSELLWGLAMAEDWRSDLEVWLVGGRRSTGEQKYYVSSLLADATLKMLAAAIKARRICEQAYQLLKEELGLDHFEG